MKESLSFGQTLFFDLWRGISRYPLQFGVGEEKGFEAGDVKENLYLVIFGDGVAIDALHLADTKNAVGDTVTYFPLGDRDNRSGRLFL